MDDQASKDAAAKQRIIGHMNADHHDSVIRYLEHYHKQSSWSAYSGKIADISLSDITFQSDAGTFTTPLAPPMSSYRDARERLVAMDKDCVQALGRSDITIREWPAPTGARLVIFLTMAGILLVNSRRANFAPNSLLAMVLPEALRSFSYWLQPYLATFLFGVHGCEVLYMAFGRLKRHNVNPRSKVFWQWLGDVLVVGFGAFQKFDKLVQRKQAAKATLKH